MNDSNEILQVNVIQCMRVNSIIHLKTTINVRFMMKNDLIITNKII